MDEEAPSLPRVTAERLIAQLEEKTPTDGAIACDADGTLWSGDIGIDSFTTLLRTRALRPAALPALNEEARLVGLGPAGDANVQALRLYDAFEKGTYAEDRAFAMMAWSLAGYRTDEARSFAIGVIEEHGLRSRLHAELLHVVRWASQKKVPLYVVSASPAWVVGPAVEMLRLPVLRVLAMTPNEADGAIGSTLALPATYGEGKSLALRAVLGGARLVCAFGDSAYDVAMLSQAEVPVAVRPKPSLRARAHEVENLLELEPLQS
jgi:phosphoserine phosphatase